MPTPSDTAWAAFSDHGPWELDRDDIGWLRLAETLRQQAQAEVPGLTEPSRVPPGLRVLTVVGRLGGALVPWAIKRRTHCAIASEEIGSATSLANPRVSNTRASCSATPRERR